MWVYYEEKGESGVRADFQGIKTFRHFEIVFGKSVVSIIYIWIWRIFFALCVHGFSLRPVPRTGSSGSDFAYQVMAVDETDADSSS